MQKCIDCKFNKELQKVGPNPKGIKVISKCSLFGIQILDQQVDACNGKMPIQGDDNETSD